MTQKIILLAAFALFSQSPMAQAEWGNDKLVKKTSDDISCVPQRVRQVLSKVADKFGKTTINSARRLTSAEASRLGLKSNDSRGGAKKSQHLLCKAVDFSIPNKKAKERELVAFLKQQKSGGLLRYNVYCTGNGHIDNNDRGLPDSYASCVEGPSSRKNYKRNRRHPS